MCVQTCPSGNYWEYYAIAMGSRSQASKTYLEKKLDEFEDCSAEELVKHAMRALEESCGTRGKKEEKDSKLTKDNCTIALVGEKTPLLVLDGDDVAQYVDAIHSEQDEQAAAAATQAAAEMSIDAGAADLPSVPTGTPEPAAGADNQQAPTEEAPPSEEQQPMEEG